MKKKTLNYFLYSLAIKYPTPPNLNYNYNWEVLALICLAIQILSGILLVMFYVPEMSMAFNSIARLMIDVEYGWLLRYLHANVASFFFVIVYLHMARALFYGSYKKPRQFLWNSGIVILFLLIITAFLGYTLPWGQMSFWGATVITNFVSILPIIDYDVLEWLWGGLTVGNATLGRFFSLHYFFPFLILGVVIAYLYKLHNVGSSNPIGTNYSSDKGFFGPYFLLKDTFTVFIFVIYFSSFREDTNTEFVLCSFIPFEHSPDLAMFISENIKIFLILNIILWITFFYVLFRDIFKYITKQHIFSSISVMLFCTYISYSFPLIRRVLLGVSLFIAILTYLQQFKPFKKITIHLKIKNKILKNIENTKAIFNFLISFNLWLNLYVPGKIFLFFALYSHICGFIYIFLTLGYVLIHSFLTWDTSLIFLTTLYLCFIGVFLKFIYNLSTALVLNVVDHAPEKLQPFFVQLGIPEQEDPQTTNNNSQKGVFNSNKTYYNNFNFKKFTHRVTQYHKIGVVVGIATLGVTAYYAHGVNVSAQAAVHANKLTEYKLGLITEEEYKKQYPCGKK